MLDVWNIVGHIFVEHTCIFQYMLRRSLSCRLVEMILSCAIMNECYEFCVRSEKVMLV